MSEPLSFDPADIAACLLTWYAESGRDLPWRQTRDPYRIWLSEIMLQQTTVVAVIPYYEKFLAAFPDVETLAAAPVEAVIELWAGLGYYRRARNLHAAATRVVEEHGSLFPVNLDQLQALPGVGRSTAGAILSIAFDLPAPILDGNVRRVLCRLFALQQPPRSSAAEKQLWLWAELLTPADRSHDYAQAIMDLGATVCTPKTPDCSSCPLVEFCQARLLGVEQQLPLASPKKAIPTVCQVALAQVRDGQVLVRRRPLDGMLAGLWEFPATELLAGEDGAVAARRLLTGLCGQGEVTSLGRVRHVYSHFRLELELYQVQVGNVERLAEGNESRWVAIESLADFPLHGAHKKCHPLLAAGG
jgi:A/G-specific adenine glycosylase